MTRPRLIHPDSYRTWAGTFSLTRDLLDDLRNGVDVDAACGRLTVREVLVGKLVDTGVIVVDTRTKFLRLGQDVTMPHARAIAKALLLELSSQSPT